MITSRASIRRFHWKHAALFFAGLPLSAGLLPGAIAADPAGAADTDPALEAAAISLRVATIGYRLASTNVALCPHHVMATGLILHDLSAYDRKLRGAVASQLALGDGFGIRAIIPGSPAQRAGLQPGDELVAMDGKDLRSFRPDLILATASFSRTEAFSTALAQSLETHGVELRALRDGEPLTVRLDPQPACDVQFTVEHAKGTDAWTDGRYVAVTDSLAQLLDDDELAFAIGHEVAHVALQHPSRPRRPFAAIGIGSGRIRAEEAAADRLAVHFMDSAGYRTDGAARMFGTLANSGGMSFSLTHPSTKARIAAVTREALALTASK
jgi:Zn-dependent protease with chaperone function